MKLGLKVAIGVAGGGLVLVGCSDKNLEPWQDADVGQRNNNAADVVVMPDGFSNVATKCDGPNRVYVAFKGDSNRAAISVVANDPRCGK